MWGLGGSIGLLMTMAGLTVRLATSEYTLRLQVKDSQGPLTGVWVSLDDRDVVATDPQGAVQFKARRYELDSALVTVSDPALNTLHLSKTFKTKISWLPWENEQLLQVELPVIGPNSPVVNNQGSDRGGSVDLSLEGEIGSGASGEFSQRQTGPEMARPLREDVLANPEESTQPITQSEKPSAQDELTSTWVRPLFCLLAGVSDQSCASAQPTLKPPMLAGVKQSTEKNNQNTVSASEKNALSSAVNNSEITENSQSAKRNETLSKGTIRIEASESGKPLQGALVYLSRLKDNRVRELGQTSSDGSLVVKVSPEFWGEAVTVFHPCCAPRTQSAKLTKQGAVGTERLRIEMQSGTGIGVLVQQEAYGHLRKVEHFELASTQGKLAVSAQDGFALYDSTKTPDQRLSRVIVRGTRPGEFFVAGSDIQAPRHGPLSFVVAPEDVYLPSLAVVERSSGRVFQGVFKSSELRRWRRDFMARLMQQSSLRSVVSSESETRISAAGESLVDVVSRGWSETQLAGEWDFLLSVDYDENLQTVKLNALDAHGKNFFDRVLKFSPSAPLAPESVSRRVFESFVEAVPFEAHVVSQNGAELSLGFSSQKLFGLKPGMPLALYQQTSGDNESQKPDELAALAQVSENGEGKGVRAKIIYWNKQTRKTEVLPDVVRAVKLNDDEFQRESLRRGLAKSTFVPKSL